MQILLCSNWLALTSRTFLPFLVHPLSRNDSSGLSALPPTLADGGVTGADLQLEAHLPGPGLSTVSQLTLSPNSLITKRTSQEVQVRVVA